MADVNARLGVVIDPTKAEKGAKRAISAAQRMAREMNKAAKQMDSIEAELLDAGPNYGRYTFNQEPGCRLWGLRIVTTRRAAAMGRCANAVKFLTGDGWKKAARSDGKNCRLEEGK